MARLQMQEDENEEHISHKTALWLAVKDPKTWVSRHNPQRRSVVVFDACRPSCSPTTYSTLSAQSPTSSPL